MCIWRCWALICVLDTWLSYSNCTTFNIIIVLILYRIILENEIVASFYQWHFSIIRILLCQARLWLRWLSLFHPRSLVPNLASFAIQLLHYHVTLHLIVVLLNISVNTRIDIFHIAQLSNRPGPRLIILLIKHIRRSLLSLLHGRLRRVLLILNSFLLIAFFLLFVAICYLLRRMLLLLIVWHVYIHTDFLFVDDCIWRPLGYACLLLDDDVVYSEILDSSYLRESEASSSQCLIHRIILNLSVRHHLLLHLLIQQIVFEIVCSQRIFTLCCALFLHLIDPSQQLCGLVSFWHFEVSQGTHLRIDKRISQYQLLRRHIRSIFRQFIPFWREGAIIELLVESLLIGGELVYESRSYLQIRSPAIQKFKTLEQWPSVLSHDVCCQSACRSALASDWVNKHTFGGFDCFLDEVKYCVACFVFAVEDNLVVLIEPEEGEICDADWFPMIRYLFACAIDDMSYLIGNHEFNVLRCKLITYEQPIFDFDGSNHVRIHLILLLLLLLLLLLCIYHLLMLTSTLLIHLIRHLFILLRHLFKINFKYKLLIL